MDQDSKIYIAGHRGLVGSAILRKLDKEGYKNIIYKTHKELDLTRQISVEKFFHQEKPEYVILSAGRVGGIGANSSYIAEFYYENNMIVTNVIHTAYKNKVKKLLYLGSSCIYPRMAKQPILENELLSGLLEPTNEGYALAKIGGLKMCDFYREQYGTNFISAMPSSLYGINDNFDLFTSHLIPALIRKFHEAKINNLSNVVVWGTGTPYREIMFVDDLADALLFLMLNYNDKGHINIGTGIEYTILEYAKMVKEVVGFPGEIIHDLSKPDGVPRKLLDVTKINDFGWKATTSMITGLRIVYEWFKENYSNIETANTNQSI